MESLPPVPMPCCGPASRNEKFSARGIRTLWVQRRRECEQATDEPHRAASKLGTANYPTVPARMLQFHLTISTTPATKQRATSYFAPTVAGA
jgi:hypothetical protein